MACAACRRSSLMENSQTAARDAALTNLHSGLPEWAFRYRDRRDLFPTTKRAGRCQLQQFCLAGRVLNSHFPSDSEFLLKVKQRCPTGFLHKVPNRCPLIFCEAWRRVHEASDAHWHVRYRRTTLGKEGHSDLEHTALKPRAWATERIETNEVSRTPGATAGHCTGRVKNSERAGCPNRATCVKYSGAGYSDDVARFVCGGVWRI